MCCTVSYFSHSCQWNNLSRKLVTSLSPRATWKRILWKVSRSSWRQNTLPSHVSNCKMTTTTGRTILSVVVWEMISRFQDTSWRTGALGDRLRIKGAISVFLQSWNSFSTWGDSEEGILQSGKMCIRILYKDWRSKDAYKLTLDLEWSLGDERV